jgi:putative phosphotransacetylase
VNQQLVRDIVDEVVQRLHNEMSIEIEASGKHVHLSRKEIDALFGKGYQLTKTKELSQPGQYACKERVTLIGPKGCLHQVVVLGPERKEAQAEVSLTDALSLGIDAPLKESGQIEGTPGVIVASGGAIIRLEQGLIAAKRHIHMSIEDALKFQLKNGEIVRVEVCGKRPLAFDDVLIRVSSSYKTYMHIDYDEANACGFVKGTRGRIIRQGRGVIK